MMKPIIRLTVLIPLSAMLLSSAARADSEADRLRDALRSATAQTRQLEDERTALQAKLADAERDKAAAKAQIDAAKAEARQARKEQREAILVKVPSGRLGAPADVAAAAVYLASEEAAYVTGQTIHVNGGMAMF